MILATLMILFTPPDIIDDPAFITLKTLVGGSWTGIVEKGSSVEFHYTLQHQGRMIVGDGTLHVGPKAIPMRVSLGWDPDKKQVYYLDQHGADTVYFGHVVKEGDSLLWDFRALCGDAGHYLSKEKIGLHEYTSEMSAEKDGKWVDIGFHLAMHRKGS